MTEAYLLQIIEQAKTKDTMPASAVEQLAVALLEALKQEKHLRSLLQTRGVPTK